MSPEMTFKDSEIVFFVLLAMGAGTTTSLAQPATTTATLVHKSFV